MINSISLIFYKWNQAILAVTSGLLPANFRKRYGKQLAYTGYHSENFFRSVRQSPSDHLRRQIKTVFDNKKYSDHS